MIKLNLENKLEVNSNRKNKPYLVILSKFNRL
jgi:hypothetical protein